MKIIESKSEWVHPNITRLTIVTSDGNGKIQVDLTADDDDYVRFANTALIWDLYVSPQSRKKGVATQLITYAISRAKDYGYSTATLEWERGNTPYEILLWYTRLGFEEKEFGRDYSLMVKRL